ncbi:MAG TPA: 4-carboxy-4-hydroxy-2-oxoadipate aldolase/oxaloacetate decarboxylase [Vicinamibacterales bacterium]|jgi:4-hydroxy-4-methyl-2-oxoglutarate aldolase
MTPAIVRTISRADPADIAKLGACGVATVHEAQNKAGLLAPCIRPLFTGARVAGSAVTVLCGAGDNLMLHAALAVVHKGDVLVVAADGESTHGMFGDLLAESCRTLGVAGLVIDAGVRDTTDITALGFPVWSKAISAQGTGKLIAGSVNIPITCAGAMVHPGDVVIADADGVVIVPRDTAPAVVAAANARLAKEELTRARLKAGELGLDIYGLRDVLAARGVVWKD